MAYGVQLPAIMSPDPWRPGTLHGSWQTELESLQMQLVRQALADREAVATPAATPVAQALGKVAAAHPVIAGGLLAGGSLLAHSAMMRDKRKAQRERRNIKIQAGIERGQETQAITEAALGTARRMGSDVAAVAAANGMGGSGPALNAVLQNRAQILSGIPDQVRAARAAIAQQEQARLAETGDGTEIPAFLLRTLLPQGGDFLRGAFSK